MLVVSLIREFSHRKAIYHQLKKDLGPMKAVDVTSTHTVAVSTAAA